MIVVPLINKISRLHPTTMPLLAHQSFTDQSTWQTRNFYATNDEGYDIYTGKWLLLGVLIIKCIVPRMVSGGSEYEMVWGKNIWQWESIEFLKTQARSCQKVLAYIGVQNPNEPRNLNNQYFHQEKAVQKCPPVKKRWEGGGMLIRFTDPANKGRLSNNNLMLMMMMFIPN